MSAVHVFIEEGGNSDSTKTACRKAFRLLFDRALGEIRKPRISACGSRNEAFRDFRRSLVANPETFAVLLVDSEDPVPDDRNVWTYLEDRDHWRRPTGASDEQVHLMVQCIEAWFLADRECLRRFYGQGFKGGSLPENQDVERIAKADVMRGLDRATKATQKKEYHKTRHGFAILGLLDPTRIQDGSRHARAFFRTLRLRLPAESDG